MVFLIEIILTFGDFIIDIGWEIILLLLGMLIAGTVYFFKCFILNRVDELEEDVEVNKKEILRNRTVIYPDAENPINDSILENIQYILENIQDLSKRQSKMERRIQETRRDIRSLKKIMNSRFVDIQEDLDGFVEDEE